MKKTITFIYLLSFVAMFAVGAQAATIKEGAVMCISKKYLERYEALQLDGAQEFMDAIEDRAQCVIRKNELKATLLTASMNHVQVQTIDGFRVWLNKAHFEEEDEKPVAKSPLRLQETELGE